MQSECQCLAVCLCVPASTPASRAFSVIVCVCVLCVCVCPVPTEPYLSQPSGFRSLGCQRQIALSLPQHPPFLREPWRLPIPTDTSRKSPPDKCIADGRDSPTSLSPPPGFYFITLPYRSPSWAGESKHPFLDFFLIANCSICRFGGDALTPRRCRGRILFDPTIFCRLEPGRCMKLRRVSQFVFRGLNSIHILLLQTQKSIFSLWNTDTAAFLNR